MEGFLIRGWKLILRGCGGTSALARLHGPQPISNHPVGLGFPHPSGRYGPGDGCDPGDLRFRPQVVGVVKVLNDF